MTASQSIRPYVNQAYLLGLMMMAAGLTLSPFLMSLSQFWLALVWFVDGFCTKSFRQKLSRFWHNKAAVLLVAFYLMHVVGLLWTTDFQYALKDLRVKLPILVLPFIMSSMEPLDRKRFDILMLVYVLSVFVATLFSFGSYVRHDYGDIREISHFISHIRFCLNIVFCIAVVGYYLFNRNTQWWNKVIQVLLLLWFVYQIYIFESLSGYVALAGLLVVTVVYALLQWKTGKAWHIAIGVSVLSVLLVGAFMLVRMARPLMQVKPVDFNSLEQTTAKGNLYWHDTIYNSVEDGKYVGLYYCRVEMQEAWPLRSDLPFEGTTLNGENLEATIARYLTSKDLRKDAEGIMALTDEDIRNIEQGVANYNNWRHPGLRARLSVTAFEYNMYRRSGNPNGGSLVQRIEFTRAALHIIRQHPLFGVGTGDVPQSFVKAYDEIQSPLNDEHRFRAHNQYLSIMIAFGAVGLALFLVALLYPWCSSKRCRTYLYTVFLVIMLLSMLAEDTLETQAGASLFAFLESVLLFAMPQEDDIKEKQPSK